MKLSTKLLTKKNNGNTYKVANWYINDKLFYQSPIVDSMQAYLELPVEKCKLYKDFLYCPVMLEGNIPAWKQTRPMTEEVTKAKSTIEDYENNSFIHIKDFTV